MASDNYIRIRCSSVEKFIIQSRADELHMSLTEYILSACMHERHDSCLDNFVTIPVLVERSLLNNL